MMDTLERSRILDGILSGVEKRDLSREEAVFLLQTDPCGGDVYKILAKANAMSREEYHNTAYIFAQIGLDAQPCSGNCKFCSLAASHYAVGSRFQKTMADAGELKEQVCRLAEAGTHDIFLMTTAEYPIPEYLTIGRAVRASLPESVRLVANIGDFTSETALRLREAGFTGAYHIKRLREGLDTDLDPQVRLQTIQTIHDSGLELYYCVEPIGPEHSYEEIAEEMLRARALEVQAMAVMRRTPVPGTALAHAGMISAAELTKIAAVARLVSRPSRSMNAHEVTPMSLLAGVNQLYAEAGANPRDQAGETSSGRGYGVAEVAGLLLDAQYVLA